MVTKGCSIYVKAEFIYGENWKLISGKAKFESFEVETSTSNTPIEQPFDLHFISQDVRGWPKLIVEVWVVDTDGRHSIGGYGIISCPFRSGDHVLSIPCWRPKGTWFDNFIGAHSELQHRSVIVSSLSKFGLKTYSTGKVVVELKIMNKDFSYQGVQM